MADRNIKLVVAYDGTRYHGWQRQRNEITIQEVLEKQIEMMTGEPVKLIASGRTDAGVHALNQVCNFITRSTIPLASIKKGLNSLLPDDIFVKEAEYAPIQFHSRYSAKSKTYEYRILNRRQPDLFLRFYTWHIPLELDLAQMQACLPMLVGRHDFSSFRSSGSGKTDPVRHMMRAELHQAEEGILKFIFVADGFLRHMVRNIVGTLMYVGLGKIGADGFLKILHGRDRRLAGIKAPPQGLFLTMVHYGSP